MVGDDEDELVDFVALAGGDAASDQHSQTTISHASSTRSIHHEYTSRKPTWWKKRSGKASKGQRRVMASLQEFYSISKPPYGEWLSWESIFPSVQEREIWLEIGFGLGDNLLCLAAQSPSSNMDDDDGLRGSLAGIETETTSPIATADIPKSRCLVGAEIHAAGLGTLYTRLQSALATGEYWQEYTLWNDDNNGVNSSVPSSAVSQAVDSSETIEDCELGDAEPCSETQIDETNGNLASAPPLSLYHHLRIYAGDGTKLLPSIPDASVTAVIIAFPDPFMAGRREEQWRLLQLSVLSEFRRILNGRLYLATDHAGYHAWSHAQVNAFNHKQVGVIPNAATVGTCKDDAIEYRRTTFTLVEPTPHRSTWLPVISKYEQKGWDEGRTTHLSCWE